MAKKLSYFLRKADYSERTVAKAKALLTSCKNMGFDILMIPGTDCIHCYYGGYSFAEIRDSGISCPLGDGYKKYVGEEIWKEIERDFDGFLFGDAGKRHIEIILDGVYASQPRDFERHTQYEIAKRNISFADNAYSVCGFEEAIPSIYFDDGIKPEIDLVLIHPSRKELMLVEFKCRKASLTGEKGVVAHAVDYLRIKMLGNRIHLAEEMVKSYNLMNQIYGGTAHALYADDIKEIKLAFLLTGSNVPRTGEDISGRLNANDFQSAKNMINRTKLLNNQEKKSFLWYWSENYETVTFEKKDEKGGFFA